VDSEVAYDEKTNIITYKSEILVKGEKKAE
jgi:hypothetical protein